MSTRHCVGLVYASTRERPHYRLLRKAQNLRVRCGGDFNVTEPFPPKPKGMDWNTYWRLRAESEDAALGSLLAAVQQFGILPPSSPDLSWAMQTSETHANKPPPRLPRAPAPKSQAPLAAG